MESLKTLQEQVIISRTELKNIRQEMLKLRTIYEKEISKINSLLFSNRELNLPKSTEIKDAPSISSSSQSKNPGQDIYHMKPIGYIESCFKTKNGTPRQASLCPESKAYLKINKNAFTKPYEALEGLDDFSHIWIIFLFHDNSNYGHKTKIHPPKLDGSSIGVFASRSPHRPNPIGLSLVQLDKIEGSLLTLSGIDLIDGTPVLDIKPYIPAYDSAFSNTELNVDDKKISENFPASELCDLRQEIPLKDIDPKKSPKNADPKKSSKNTDPKKSSKNTDPKKSSKNADPKNIAMSEGQGCIEVSEPTIEKTTTWISDQKQSPSEAKQGDTVKTATWVVERSLLDVSFTNRAEKELTKFHSKQKHEKTCEFCLNFLKDEIEAKISIIKILQNDPRSVYRRAKCQDKLYYFPIDSLHVTCWFDDMSLSVEVLRIQPIKNATFINKSPELSGDEI